MCVKCFPFRFNLRNAPKGYKKRVEPQNTLPLLPAAAASASAAAAPTVPSFSPAWDATTAARAMADEGSSSDDDKDYDPMQDMTAKQVKKAKINAIWEEMNAKSPAAGAQESARASSLAAGANKAKISAIWEQMNARSNSTVVQKLTKPAATGAGGQSKVSEEIAAAAKAAAALVKTEPKAPAAEQANVSKSSDLQSKAAEAAERKAKMVASSSRGLDALLQQISKKPKISVLDKSRQDWGQFKEEKGLEDELEAYKKSGDKYLDKVAFLQRADVREYEKEREVRLAMQAKRRNEASYRE